MADSSQIEAPSKPDRTAVEAPPAIEFIGLEVFVERDGEHVTGRVVFPHPVGGDLTEAAKAYREGKRVTGRTECPIDYRSKRPDAPPDGAGQRAAWPSPPAGQLLDDRGKQKLIAVLSYIRLCTDNPNTPKLELARRVIKVARAGGMKRISVRSLQLWTRRIELEGQDALRDHYVKPTPKVPTFDADHARQGLMVCAWWAYRIGNCQTIDTKMMAVAVALIAGTDDTPAYPLADLLATIDCYYSWPCNRETHQFKPFGRWAKYDLDRWLCRATEANDYRRQIAEGRTEKTSLQTIDRRRDVDRQRSVSITATRKRQTGNHRTRCEIHKLAGPGVDTPPPVNSLVDPETIAEALAGLMDDKWRCLLLRAAGRDADPAARRARTEAVATLLIWWQWMPRSITSKIDFHIDQWRRAHQTATDKTANRRRFLMFLSHLRNKRGVERLAVAARITA